MTGPGDGVPVHDDYLRPLWGRKPSLRSGDVLGIAFLSSPHPAAALLVEAYYGQPVPAAVLEWFGARFPAAELTPPPAAG